jgi:hypothetical protein
VLTDKDYDALDKRASALTLHELVKLQEEVRFCMGIDKKSDFAMYLNWSSLLKENETNRLYDFIKRQNLQQRLLEEDIQGLR